MIRISLLRRFAALLALAIAGGCGQQQQAAQQPVAARAEQPAAEAAASAQVSAAGKVSAPAKTAAAAALAPADCRAFADGLLAAIESGKLNRVNEKMNWPAVLEHATAGIDAPPALRRQFIDRGLQAAHGDDGFSAKLLQTIKDGGTLKFLRLHDVSSARRVLIRLVRKDGGLGYLDFVLGEDALGHVRIVDVDPVQDGQLLSETIRETYLQVLFGQQPKIVALLDADDRHFAEAAPLLARVSGFRKAGNFPQAMEAFEELPRELRVRKSFQRLHVAVAHGLGSQQYATALDEFRGRFPGDPSVDLLSADEFIRTKQFDMAAACIHRLDQRVDDPYLDVMLARLYLQAGEPESARYAADQAIQRAPRDLDAYQARLSVSLAEKKFADTARLLHYIGTRFGAEFHDLKSLPAYAEFVKSPDYDAWLKAQAEVPKQANNK